MLFPNINGQIVLDDISPKLKHFIMRKEKNQDITTGLDIWNIDFDRIHNLYPGLRRLILMNHYRFNGDIIIRFIEWLRRTKNTTLEFVKFMFFDVVTLDNKLRKHMYVQIEHIDSSLISDLKTLGWGLRESKLSGFRHRVCLR